MKKSLFCGFEISNGKLKINCLMFTYCKTKSSQYCDCTQALKNARERHYFEHVITSLIRENNPLCFHACIAKNIQSRVANVYLISSQVSGSSTFSCKKMPLKFEEKKSSQRKRNIDSKEMRNWNFQARNFIMFYLSRCD